MDGLMDWIECQQKLKEVIADWKDIDLKIR